MSERTLNVRKKYVKRTINLNYVRKTYQQKRTILVRIKYVSRTLLDVTK